MILHIALRVIGGRYVREIDLVYLCGDVGCILRHGKSDRIDPRMQVY